MATVSTVSRVRSAALGRRGAGDAERWGRRLRERLVAAGPLAARFGIYLGSRTDLFPGIDCLDLLEIPDRGPASHPARVAELLERQLGGRPEELFEQFDHEPVDSGLVVQVHRARLAGGAAVAVELVHPELVAELEDGALHRVVGELVAAGELPPTAGEAVAEFELQLDLRQASLALEALADETADSRWIDVPRSFLRLSSHRVRVFSELESLSAEAVAGSRAERGSLEALARRMSRGWLALALAGRLYPAMPWGRDVRFLRNGRVAFLGGGSHRLPRTAQAELREYLAAVAAKKPALAALALLELLPGGRGDNRLRDRLRHTDPFRDRDWDVGGDLFVRQVLAHWRTASRLGYHLPDNLMPFYRGLFLLNQVTRRLAGDASPVRDGLREARLLLLFDEVRQEAESGHWGGTLERQLTLVGGLPQKLDRILTLAAEDDRRDVAASGSVSKAPRSGGGLAVAACLLALTAVVLLTHHLIDAGTPGGWVEPLGAVFVLLLGAAVLRAATHDGDK